MSQKEGSLGGDRQMQRRSRETGATTERHHRQSAAFPTHRVEEGDLARSSGLPGRPGSTQSTLGRLLLVDDHALFAEALADALTQSGVDVTLADSTDPDVILDEVAGSPPDIAIVDFHLGPHLDATPLIARLAHHGVAVVVVTANASRTVAARCYEAGARGVLGKGIPLEALLEALETAAAGSSLIDGPERHALLTELRLERAKRQARMAPFQALTLREAEVLRNLCEGYSASEVADTFFVSIATVRSQIRAILTKLGVNSQLAAVAEAFDSGWVDQWRERGGSTP